MKICNTCLHPWDQHQVMTQPDLVGKIGCRITKCQCQYTEDIGRARQEPIEGEPLATMGHDDL